MKKPLLLFSFICVTAGLQICAGCNKPGQTAHTEAPTAPSNVRSSGEVVKVAIAPVTIGAGSASEAIVTLSITSGYHVNANPATFAYLIATEVSPGTVEGITAGKPVYPVGTKQKFEFAEEPLAVYEGETQIKLPLTPAATAAKGSRTLPLNVRVQACDHEKCYPPDTLRSTISVEVK
jgi:hypothetical protein